MTDHSNCDATEASMAREIARLQAENGRLTEALKYYNGLRIEVIRECGGGMCEVPHKVNLFDVARQALTEPEKGMK